jgi:hypothetical protein
LVFLRCKIFAYSTTLTHEKLKICFKLNKTAAETHRMLKEALGEQAFSQVRTYEWFKCLKDGWESVDDRQHSGRPSACTTPEMIAKVRTLSYKTEDRLSTMFIIALDCHRVCQRILAEEWGLVVAP